MIRFASFLLIGYVIVSFYLNQILQRPVTTVFPGVPGPQQGVQSVFQSDLNYLYYVFYLCIALVCLAIAYWPKLREKLGRVLIPLVVAILTISPVIINQFAVPQSPLGPRFGSPEASLLMALPFTFVALLFIAWQYRWQNTLYVILGIAALNLGVRWASSGLGTQPFQAVLAIVLIQTVVFLVVGFSISFLMSRMRAQQQSLESANNRLTQYASTLEQLATSRERNRLALELHDTLAHTLSGLSVQLETIKAYWDVDRPTAHAILEKSLAATHLGLEETRRALKALRASPLEDMGLPLALRKMVEDAASRAGLALDMPETIMVPPLPPDVEQCLYRVAQEAVTNVVKHASAKKITVRLEFADSTAMLMVLDDGVGFDADKVDNTNHFGLAGMQERSRISGGELKIQSKPGTGTTITFSLKLAAQL